MALDIQNGSPGVSFFARNDENYLRGKVRVWWQGWDDGGISIDVVKFGGGMGSRWFDSSPLVIMGIGVRCLG